MKAVIQRVSSACVSVDEKICGKIEKGFLILLGIHENDTDEDAKYLAKKCSGMRIFEDNEGKMNLSVKDVGGSFLVVSNFTLYGDCRKGNRPSFTDAARPEKAEGLYEKFVEYIRDNGIACETGVFGADMMIELVNDGPITLIVESV